MLSFNGVKVVSFFPGRVRLRVERMKEDPEFAEQIKKGLTHIPGIKKLEIKESNHSVLVVYDKKKLKEPDSSKQLVKGLHKLFPDMDTGRITKLLGV